MKIINFFLTYDQILYVAGGIIAMIYIFGSLLGTMGDWLYKKIRRKLYGLWKTKTNGPRS